MKMAKDFDIEIEIKGNPLEFKAEIETALPTILQAVGTVAEGYAKEDCPVDTGLLRNSITYCIGGETPAIMQYKADNPKPGQPSSGSYNGKMPADNQNNFSVYIGSNVKYAQDVEMRDISHRVGKAHFLRDAVQNHREEYKNIIETGIIASIS